MEKKINNIKIRLYIYIIAFLLIFIVYFILPVQFLNNKLYDIKLKICGPIRTDSHKISKQIVTISIDDIKTIPQIGYPTQDVHAKMIRKLKGYDVKLIFYDFILRGNIQPSLVLATKEAGNVYWPLSFSLTSDKNDAFKLDKYPSYIQKLIKNNSISLEKNINRFWYAKQGAFLNENLVLAAKGVGDISTSNEENNINDVFRKVALIINIDGIFFPSVNLQLVCDYLNVPKNKIVINQGESIILQDAKLQDGRIKNIEIPINDKGEMLINYIKSWEINKHDYLEPFWYVTVLNLEEDPAIEKELSERLKGKICFIGNASSVNRDIHAIPIDNNYPGVGIHSHVLYTILSENFIKEVPLKYSFTILVIVLLILSYLALKIRAIIVFLLSLSSVALYLFISYMLFIILGLALADFFPIYSFIMFGSVNLLGDYLIRGKVIEILMNNLKNINNNLYQKKEVLEEMQNKLIDYETYIDEEKKDFQKKVNQLEDNIKTDKDNIYKLEKERNNLLEKIFNLTEKVGNPSSKIIEKPGKEMKKKIDECLSLGIVTQNKQMFEIFETAKKFAMTEEPVIILGETGTGKQLFAEAIHKMSSRKNKTMIEINIPSVPETLVESELFGYINSPFTGAKKSKKGLFELADKSTVFLDEIGEMKYELQSKILRVLEHKTIDKVGRTETIPIKVDIRIIVATNKNIEDEITNKRFREDLYYRLNVHTIKLIPLRERKDDILLLAEYFVKTSNSPNKRFNDEAKIKLTSYSWPGNIRELRNVVLNAMALSYEALIRAEDILLPKTAGTGNHISLKEHLEIFENVEDEKFIEIMRKNKFEIEATAKILNQSRNPVSLRFKGICFQKLSENGWDYKRATENISNEFEQKKLIEKRINEYYENLVSVIKECNNKVSALEECQRRFKNLPKKYHKYIEEVIDLVLKNR